MGAVASHKSGDGGGVLNTTPRGGMCGSQDEDYLSVAVMWPWGTRRLGHAPPGVGAETDLFVVGWVFFRAVEKGWRGGREAGGPWGLLGWLCYPHHAAGLYADSEDLVTADVVCPVDGVLSRTCTASRPQGMELHTGTSDHYCYL